MPTYIWRNTKTGEISEVVRPMSDASVPPDDSGDWMREYSLSIGFVSHSGGSPIRHVDTTKKDAK